MNGEGKENNNNKKEIKINRKQSHKQANVKLKRTSEGKKSFIVLLRSPHSLSRKMLTKRRLLHIDSFVENI